jgi:hypothetical protein
MRGCGTAVVYCSEFQHPSQNTSENGLPEFGSGYLPKTSLEHYRYTISLEVIKFICLSRCSGVEKIVHPIRCASAVLKLILKVSCPGHAVERGGVGIQLHSVSSSVLDGVNG